MDRREPGIFITPLILSALLLVMSTLFVWPHYYYVALRLVVCGTAIYVIWYCSRTHHRLWALIIGIIGVLFNPIVPIRFSRNPWHAVEIIAALLLIVSAFGLSADLKPSSRAKSRFD